MLEKKQTKKIEEILTAIDLEQPAPSEEPMRQYYFMEKARRLVKAQSETCLLYTSLPGAFFKSVQSSSDRYLGTSAL